MDRTERPRSFLQWEKDQGISCWNSSLSVGNNSDQAIINQKSLFLSFRFLGVKRWKSLFWSKRWVRPTLRKWRWLSRTWRPLCPRWCWQLLLCREENAYIGEIDPCLRLCGHQPCLLGDGGRWLLLWVRLPYLGLRWPMSPCQVERLGWPQQSIFRFWQNIR